MQTGMSSIIA